MSVAEAVEGARELALYELLRQRLLKEIIPAVPAVGFDWTATVPPGTTWDLLSVQFQFVTSAVVGNRNAMLRILDPNGLEVGRVGPQSIQAASTTNTYTYWPGFGYASGTGRQQMSLPSPVLILPTGWSIGTSTSALDVGDQYSAILCAVREWSPREVLAAADWLDDHAR